MTQHEIALASEAAYKIVATARLNSTNINPVWQKLNRVCKYIDARTVIELSATLGPMPAPFTEV
jgi:hypothetical protein